MEPTFQSDTALWELIRQGDSTAFETLYRRMWKPLYLFAYKRLKHKSDAEDVVQQVFMHIWERRASRHIETSVSGYLFTAVRYEVIDQLTAMMAAEQKIEHVEEHILPTFNDILERMLAKDVDRELSSHIDGMPRQMQHIFRLSHREQLSAGEIAQQLHISEKTVRNQLSLALQHLRPLLKKSLVLVLLLHA